MPFGTGGPRFSWQDRKDPAVEMQMRLASEKIERQRRAILEEIYNLEQELSDPKYDPYVNPYNYGSGVGFKDPLVLRKKLDLLKQKLEELDYKSTASTWEYA